MPVTTLTSREFHQNSAKVKRAAENGPVIITDRGKPSLVVQTYDDWETKRHLRDIQEFVSLFDSFSKPHPAENIEFDIPELREYPREVKFE